MVFFPQVTKEINEVVKLTPQQRVEGHDGDRTFHVPEVWSREKSQSVEKQEVSHCPFHKSLTRLTRSVFERDVEQNDVSALPVLGEIEVEEGVMRLKCLEMGFGFGR